MRRARRRAHPVPSAFAGRWTAVTRLKLLLQRGQFFQAAEDAERYLQPARQLDDRMLLGTLTWLRAHALAGSGSVSEAAGILAPLGATDAVSVPGQQGGYYRAAGMILRHSRHRVSEAMLGRALAIWQDQGNQHEPLELGQLGTPVPVRVDPTRDDQSGIKVANALAAAVNVAHTKELLGRELVMFHVWADFTRPAH